MCTNSCQKNPLPNSAVHGRTSSTAPCASTNPPGWFIQPLTEMTKSEPVIPATTPGGPPPPPAPPRNHAPAGMFPPAVDEEDEERPRHPRHDHREAGPEMQS